MTEQASAWQNVKRCRSCGAFVVWGMTEDGKRCPFDADPITGEATEISHFVSCPQAKDWFRRGKP